MLGGGPAAKATGRYQQERGQRPSSAPPGPLVQATSFRCVPYSFQTPPSLGSPRPHTPPCAGEALLSHFSGGKAEWRKMPQSWALLVPPGRHVPLWDSSLTPQLFWSLSAYLCPGAFGPLPASLVQDPGARARLPCPCVPGRSFCVPRPLLPWELVRAGAVQVTHCWARAFLLGLVARVAGGTAGGFPPPPTPQQPSFLVAPGVG